MLFSGAMLILTLGNNLTLPRYLMPLATYVLVIYLVMVGDGIRDEGILGFILVIALAGLLIGEYWVAFYTLAGILAVTIIGLGQFNGWFPTITDLAFSPSRIIIIDIIFVLIGAVIYVTIANLEHVLEQVQEHEFEIKKSNLALLNIQAGLEERIAERVRKLNITREEAETAHAEIEKQVWQTRGLAQLGNLIRGEQDAPELASKMIRHLCTYLDAMVGAIFLCDENDWLHCVGTYAYSGDQSPRFAFGEGIVGQAAQGKKTIHLTDIPEDTVRITSGLSEFPPKNIIAVPFIFGEEVLGVFEIGSLRSFEEQQLHFLENAVESICIAFHTAQTRAQVDQLLVQTREQTEKLQGQGEELRAINEELQAQAENLRFANQELVVQAEQLRSYKRQGED